jgi:oxygen tolerance protein BatD
MTDPSRRQPLQPRSSASPASLRFFLLVSILPAFFLVLSRVAWAQSAPQLQAQATARTVGVGDVVHVELSATSADTMPADPQLGATQGFVLRGQNSSPSQTHISINGSHMDRFTLTVTWALEAKRVGTFHVGPPSAVVAGVRYATRPIDISVVPAGQAPPPRAPQPRILPGMQSPFGLSPFDPWKGLIQGFDVDNQAPTPEPVLTDPKLSLDAPRGNEYFLHATVDKTTAVVGEQVTFSVYLYRDPMHADPELEEGHEATAADFAKQPLTRDDQEAPHVGFASIGARTWEVKLLRRWALFPLHRGDLAIGPMALSLHSRGAAGDTQRNSETLVVHVTEPPLTGRPAGYALGDVGHFSLAAQASPREIDEGGAVGVHVEVSGTGNVPNAIATPAREGVEWLTPEVHDELGPTGHDAFGGKRTLDFVVRMRRAGPVDLGEMTLPFWDPDLRKYQVARAPLGVVRVARSATGQSAAADPLRDMLSGLPPPRDVLEASPAPRPHADDSPVFWIGGVGAWPLAFGVAVTGRAAGRRILSSWRKRRMSPATALRQRLAAATAACDKADARTADAAIARALEAATVAHAGVNVRGSMGGEVIERLERAGVAHDAASRVVALLRECEAARFAPDAAEMVAARDRWLRAKGAIRGLEKGG